jgi:hypothetical protein
MYPSQEVMALRKAGDPRAALARGRELLAEHPSDRYLRGSVGWVLYDLLKAEVMRTPPAESQPAEPEMVARVQRLLAEYMRLELAPPDLLFSQILFQTLRLHGETQFLPRFLMWAGIDAFREEDFRSQSGKDEHVFEPLVERAARKAAGVARKQQDADAQRFAISLIDRALQRADVQGPQWLNYHKALLLERLGRHEDATALLVPFVRQKSSEFWAWHALGKVKEHGDAGLALALYAMALQTCKDPAFGSG